MIESKFSRHEALIGKKGQDLIQNTKVAIVGLGGTGSHVNQQLAYLGVMSFTLIDQDCVAISNLNRLIGADAGDVGLPKVEVAARLIHKVNPSAVINVLSKSVRCHDAFDALKQADFIFGCVDDDGIRFILNEFACAYEKPYLDLATDTEQEIGGRIVFTYDNSSCLYCLGELTNEDVHAELSTEQDRKDHERIYGVPLKELGRTGPSVVFLNGIVASLGVTEFFNFITGLLPARKYLCYRGSSAEITKRKDLSGTQCYYCQDVRGQKQAAKVERYII